MKMCFTKFYVSYIYIYKHKKSLNQMNDWGLKKGNDLLSRVSSNIGADGLNFSVRYGKRWNPVAIATLGF